jgi:dTDP-glucose 4,6-dehydratase
VYGPAPVGTWHQEWDPIVPSNPYAASKAAQEAITTSYWRAYNLPVILTNTMNIIGERQDPEKFVPMLIQRALDGTPIEIHGQDGVAGSRYYLHARNQADALLTLALAAREDHHGLEDVCRSVGRNPGGSLRYSGLPNDRPLRFHIVGEQEVTNDRLADAVVGQVIERTGVNPPDMSIVNFHASRPGHDLRYALDGERMAAIGWKAPVPLWDSLIRTVDWTLAHPEWIRL